MQGQAEIEKPRIVAEEDNPLESSGDRDSEMGLLTGSFAQRRKEDYLTDHGAGSRPRRWRTLACGWSAWLTYLNIAVLCGSVLLLMSPLSSRVCLELLSDQDKWKATSAYAPILDRFNIPRQELITNGSLYDGSPPSILRIPTGPEADAEWHRIGSHVRPLLISAEEVRKLGKDPALAVRVPDELGYGPDAYLAHTEAFHLLHCLDMLRMEISYEHYYAPRFGDDPGAEYTAHISHCIDVLAQFVKCQASVDVILFNWVAGWDEPFPDFFNKRVCRDFEALLAYVNENSVDREVFRQMKGPPEGYPVQPDPSLAPFVAAGTGVPAV